MRPLKYSRLFLLLLGGVICSFCTPVAAATLSPWITPLFQRPALAFATLFPG